MYHVSKFLVILILLTTSDAKYLKKRTADDDNPLRYLKVPIIWIIGGPGVGKGTQCAKIAEKYGFTHLSTGDLLRKEIEIGSIRGHHLEQTVNRGDLVPTEDVLQLLKEEMVKSMLTSKGFLIDGYPRDKKQGIMFEKTIARVDLIILLVAPQETMLNRLKERSVQHGRVDDNEEAIKRRLQIYKYNIKTILSQYGKKVKKINANRDPDEVFKDIDTAIKKKLQLNENDSADQTPGYISQVFLFMRRMLKVKSKPKNSPLLACDKYQSS